MPPTTRSMTAAQQRRRRNVARKELNLAYCPAESGCQVLTTRDMCQNCQNLNLDKVFRRLHGCAKGRKVGSIHWSDDSCKLCRLLDSVFGIRRHQSQFYWGPELRSYSTRCIASGRRGFPTIDAVMLSVTGHGDGAFIVPQSDGIDTVRILQPLVSLELVNRWLRHCRENHTKTCTVSNSGGAPNFQISSFRVIDCETLMIVPGQRRPYAALSYVWGQGSQCDTGFSLYVLDRQKVPNTISDAILATKGLGLDYLWIDRYCINQQDEADVSAQTSKMDLIYRNAEVTIIAAAGQDHQHGLPGIRPRRTQQPFAQVGDHLLVSTMDELSDAIMRKSIWSTRGWTYQEGVLSRRRLIFTDDQVYYECSGMYCSEVLNLPLAELHTNDGQKFKSRYCRGPNTGMFPRRLGQFPWEVVQRIEDYAGKCLSYPSDILRGFLGIFRAFETCSKPIRHVLGVPVLPQAPEPKCLDSDLWPRAWTPTMGFCLGLTWRVKRQLKRRPGFPSWSWTGWHGKVEWDLPEPAWQITFGDDSVQIDIELNDGSVMPWEAFYSSYSILSTRLSPTLRISAWTSPVRLRDYNYNDRFAQAAIDVAWGSATRGHCNLSRCPETIANRLRRRGSTSFLIEITTEIKELHSLRCMAVQIAHRATSNFDAICFLIVCETETLNLYERVAYGILYFDPIAGGPDRVVSSWKIFQLR